MLREFLPRIWAYSFMVLMVVNLSFMYTNGYMVAPPDSMERLELSDFDSKTVSKNRLRGSQQVTI